VTLRRAALVLLVVAAVRLLGGGTGSGRPEAGPRPARARELLDERYDLAARIPAAERPVVFIGP
jgi:hypothetical protein